MPDEPTIVIVDDPSFFPPEEKFSITMTEAAKTHFQTQIAKRLDGWGILLAVRTAGCSGLSYVVEFWDGQMCNRNRFDGTRPHHINEIPVVISRQHEVYFNGLEIDFVTEGLNSGLKFNNPNATSECGCGETFTVG